LNNVFKSKKKRLEYADYSEFKSYFVTICTRDREEYFGTIEDNRMKLSPIGEIVNKKWKDENGAGGCVRDEVGVGDDVRDWNRQACSLHPCGVPGVGQW